MSVREYIGARYVPMFADPIEWDSTKSYEPLVVVKHQGASYISRQSVPEGIAIDNETYWILWADYNAQLEAYRQEVLAFNGRISDLEQEYSDLEDSFPIDTENIAANAITEEKLSDELAQKVTSHISWGLLDRFPISEENNSGSGLGFQASCAFMQEGVRYAAYLIRDDSSVTVGYVNKIWIRNIDNGTTVSKFAITPCHGLSLDYNSATKELMFYDEVTNNINIVSLANIALPVLSRQINATGVSLWWGICWYDNNDFLSYREISATNRVLEILDGSTLETKGSITLTGYDPKQITFQDISYHAGVAIVGGNENIYVYDTVTGKLANCIPIPNHVSFTVASELEGVTIDDNCIYWSSGSNVDSLMLPAMYFWNYKNGNVGIETASNLYQSSDVVGTMYVDWNNGSYLGMTGTRVWKLFGDLENFVKFNYPNHEVQINLASDYPLYVYVSGIDANIQFGGFDLLVGARFEFGNYVFNFNAAGTNLGQPININHGIYNILNANSNCTADNGKFDCNTVLIFANNNVDQSKFTHAIIFSPVKPTDFISTPYNSKWIQGSSNLD